MRKMGWIAAAFLGCLPLLPAQQKPVYQVQFEVRDSGAPADQGPQRFTMRIDESRKGVFQAGQKVPGQDNLDVGAKIECAVHAAENGVAIEGSLEVSRVAGFVTVGGISEPIVQQKKVAFHKTVPLGTATAISEDPKYQVQATVALLQAAQLP